MSKDTKDIYIIGYASGNAAQNHSCCMGPIIMEQSDKITNATWLGQIYPADNLRQLYALESTISCCQKLAKHTMSLTANNEQFVTIGGDHSCAIGTWSGAAAAKQGKIGMIWISSHLSAHNTTTSQTKNINGMALSSLLNHGPSELNDLNHAGAKIDPKNLAVIGAMEYAPAEQELLTQLGVKIFYMSDIETKGLPQVFSEALEVASTNHNGFGISIAIDAAPTELLHEFKTSLKPHKHKLLGLEIAEFFPDLDKNHQAENTIADLINATI